MMIDLSPVDDCILQPGETALKMPAGLTLAMQLAQAKRVNKDSEDPGFGGMGMGWDVEEWDVLQANTTLIYSSGNTYGASAFIALNVLQERGIVVLANQGGGDMWSPGDIGDQIVDRWNSQDQYGGAPVEQASASTSLRAISGVVVSTFAWLWLLV